MGQAKRRGTFDERRAQAVALRQAREIAEAQDRRERALERERLRREARAIRDPGKSVVLTGSGASRADRERLMLAATLALAMPTKK